MWIFIGVFLASLEKQKPEPDIKRIAIEKWSNNQLLDMTYLRYIEVYNKLQHTRHRALLATEYMDILTSELFVFSSRDETKLYVTIQERFKDAKPISYRVKELSGGSETGLYDGYVAVARMNKQEPPHYYPDIDKLLSYIIKNNPITDPTITEIMFKANVSPIGGDGGKEKADKTPNKTIANGPYSVETE
jgi:hypothetical protein